MIHVTVSTGSKWKNKLQKVIFLIYLKSQATTIIPSGMYDLQSASVYIRPF